MGNLRIPFTGTPAAEISQTGFSVVNGNLSCETGSAGAISCSPDRRRQTSAPQDRYPWPGCGGTSDSVLALALATRSLDAVTLALLRPLLSLGLRRRPTKSS